MNEINNEKIIKDAQYRKGLSIAFFNATNAAIEIVKKEIEIDKPSRLNLSNVKDSLVFWRNWLLEEHKNYYATVIANIGSNYNAKETIKKLESTKTKEELLAVWQSISEDERRDGEIIKATNKLKKSYEKS